MNYRTQATIKYSAYALVLLALFILQSARGTSISLMRVSVNVMPFFVASVALYEGPYAAGTLGFFAGLLVSVHSLLIEGLSALYLGLFGVIFGWFGAKYMRKVLPSALLGGALCLGVSWLTRYVFYYSLVYSIPLKAGFGQLLWELLLSVPFGAGVFFIVRAMNRRFEVRQ